MVGCDGGHSIVREADRHRSAAAPTSTSSWCWRCSARKELHEKLKRFPPRSTYRVLHPDLKGYWQFFGRVDVGESWFFHSPVPANTTRDNYDFHGLLQRVAGFPFACEFDYVGFWDLRIAVAEKYQVGRVFIAGDAAHSAIRPTAATASTTGSTTSPISAGSSPPNCRAGAAMRCCRATAKSGSRSF